MGTRPQVTTSQMAQPSSPVMSTPARRVCRNASGAYHNGHTGLSAGGSVGFGSAARAAAHQQRHREQREQRGNGQRRDHHQRDDAQVVGDHHGLRQPQRRPSSPISNWNVFGAGRCVVGQLVRCACP